MVLFILAVCLAKLELILSLTIDVHIMEKQSTQQISLPMYHSYATYSEDAKFTPVLEITRCRSRRTAVTYFIALLFGFLIITYGSPLISLAQYRRSSTERHGPPTRFDNSNETSLVALEAHIMSKCPDARDCLRDLVVPAMEKVVDKVDFRLSYIGRVDENDTIHCKHGATECLGNMLGLCANDLFPNNTKISLGFSTCLISSYQRIPDRDLVTQCALEHGIAFNELNACISEEGKGLELLEASVERSENAGVQKSCTVRVGGEQWCIRDGGEWKECHSGHEVDDLIKEVERRYNST